MTVRTLTATVFLYYYDRTYDKQPGAKTSERRLNILERAAYNVTTSSDPISYRNLPKKMKLPSSQQTTSFLCSCVQRNLSTLGILSSPRETTKFSSTNETAQIWTWLLLTKMLQMHLSKYPRATRTQSIVRVHSCKKPHTSTMCSRFKSFPSLIRTRLQCPTNTPFTARMLRAIRQHRKHY